MSMDVLVKGKETTYVNDSNELLSELGTDFLHAEEVLLEMTIFDESKLLLVVFF